MAHIEHSTALPYPRERVFAWFERPGALVRLTPPFAGSVLSEPDDGLRDGSEARLAVGAPGVLGTGLGALAAALPLPSALPGWLRRGQVESTGRHDSYDPPRGFRVTTTGPFGRIVHEHRFVESDGGGTVLHESVDVVAPRESDLVAGTLVPTLRRVLEYRAVQLRDDLAFYAAHADAGPRTIAVAGASGLIGTQLCALLSVGGHRVLRLVRRPAETSDEISWDPAAGRLDPEALRDVDAVVNLAGRSIGGRFTAAAKDEILTSRAEGTLLIARALADLAGDGRRRAFVCASGIGYYGTDPHGDGDDAPLTEDSPSGAGFLALVCREWEGATEPAEKAGVRVVNVRTGLVQSPAEGSLSRLLPLFAVGLGGPLDREQWQSWISVDDVVSVYAHAVLTDDLAGPLNAVGPEPVRGAEYARTLGKVLRRPALVPVPSFGPRLVVGSEGAQELAYASQRVSSDRLEASGYTFRHRTLGAALRHVLP
ncbi:TIGR01777 family oxidoreductase [Georgenia muralis]